MEVLLIFLTIFVTLVASLCTALLAPLRQLWSRVDPSHFKRVKLPYPLSLLFVGIGGKRSKHGDVSKYGVILPMLVLHILGYLLTVFIWAIVPVLYYRAGIDLDVLFVFPLAVAVFDVIAVVLTEVICVAYVNKKHLEASYEEDLVEEEPIAPVAPVKKAVVEKVEQPVEKVIEEPQPVAEEQPVEQVEEPVVETPVEPVAEEVAEEPVVEEHIAEEPAEPQVEEVTEVEQPAEEVTEEPTEKKDND